MAKYKKFINLFFAFFIPITPILPPPRPLPQSPLSPLLIACFIPHIKIVMTIFIWGIKNLLTSGIWGQLSDSEMTSKLRRSLNFFCPDIDNVFSHSENFADEINLVFAWVG